MEARITSRSRQEAPLQMMPAAQVVPVIVLPLGKHYDDVHIGKHLAEAVDGVHEHRPPVEGQKLLGYIATHTQPLASRHQYGKPLHSGYEL